MNHNNVAHPSFCSPTRLGAGDQSPFSSIISSPNIVVGRPWNGTSAETHHEGSVLPATLFCEECQKKSAIIEALKKADNANIHNIDVLRQSLEQVNSEREMALGRNSKLFEALEVARLQELSRERETLHLQSEVARLNDKLESEKYENSLLMESCISDRKFFFASQLLSLELLEESKRAQLVLSESLWFQMITSNVVALSRKEDASQSQCTNSPSLVAAVRDKGLNVVAESPGFASRDSRVSPRFAPSTSRSRREECRPAHPSTSKEDHHTLEALQSDLRLAALKISSQKERIAELFEQAQLVEEMQAEVDDLITNELELRESLSRKSIEEEYYLFLLDTTRTQLERKWNFQGDIIMESDTPLGLQSPGRTLSCASNYHKLHLGYKRRHIDPLAPSDIENSETPANNVYRNEVFLSQLKENMLERISAELSSVRCAIQKLTDVGQQGDNNPSLPKERLRELAEVVAPFNERLKNFEASLSQFGESQKSIFNDLRKTVSNISSVQNEVYHMVSSIWHSSATVNEACIQEEKPFKDPSSVPERSSEPGISPDSKENSRQPSEPVGKQTTFPLPVFTVKPNRSSTATGLTVAEELFNPSAISFNTLPSRLLDIADSGDDELNPPVSLPTYHNTR